MKNLVSTVLVLLFSGVLSAADAAKSEAKVINVSGMHCGSCVRSLNKKVCKANESEYASCSVELTKPDQEMGEIRVTPKDGQPLNLEKIKKQVSDAGYQVKD